MNPTIDKLKLLFLGIFAILAIASWGYQVLWVWPARRALAGGADGS